MPATNENGPTYTWNAEEQITVAGGVTYTYDGDGLRVKKSNGKLYWRSTGMDVLAETDLAGDNPIEFIYFAGQRVAARHPAGGGQDYYIFSDHLGSSRVITNASGTVCGDEDYLPYGAEKVTATCWVNYKFTTYERDPETGLDYAAFRYYNSRLGRFMSPDILAGGVDDPQSLNRYAYVLNDPVNLDDPLGLVNPEREFGAVDRIMAWEVLRFSGAATWGNCTQNGVTVHCSANVRLARRGQGASNWVFTLTEQWRVWGCLYQQDRRCQISIVEQVLTLSAVQIFDPWAYFMNHARRVREQRSAGGTLDALEIFAQVGQTAGFVTNPCFIAGWYGASAIVGGGGIALASAPSLTAIAVAGREFVQTPGVITDFISGMTPASSVPSSYSGAAGLLTSHFMSNGIPNPCN